MLLLTWSNNLSVGVEEIDAQHKKLIQVLDRVIKYTTFHFGTEENLMSEYDYPLSSQHKNEHRKLVEKALDLQTKFKLGKTRITMETMTFLRDWLQEHILKTDKSLGAYLKSRGRS